MARAGRRGIFCLEGDWSGDLERPSTIKPVLKLLAQSMSRPVRYIHRDVGTTEEFRYFLTKWRQKNMSAYPILYLAFHGERGRIVVGDGRRRDARVSLDQLASWIGRVSNGRMVHFGSCETLHTDKRNLRRFMAQTNVTAVTGYRDDVDWITSAAFEVLLMDVMLRRKINTKHARLIRDDVRNEFHQLADKHDFRLVVRDE